MTNLKQDYKNHVAQFEENGQQLFSQKGWRILDTTPGGKKIMLVPDGVYGMYEVKFEDGGARPPEFRQKFTSEREAAIAVQDYMNSRYNKKEEESK